MVSGGTLKIVVVLYVWRNGLLSGAFVRSGAGLVLKNARARQ